MEGIHQSPCPLQSCPPCPLQDQPGKTRMLAGSAGCSQPQAIEQARYDATPWCASVRACCLLLPLLDRFYFAQVRYSYTYCSCILGDASKSSDQMQSRRGGVHAEARTTLSSSVDTHCFAVLLRTHSARAVELVFTWFTLAGLTS